MQLTRLHHVALAIFFVSITGIHFLNLQAYEWTFSFIMSLVLFNIAWLFANERQQKQIYQMQSHCALDHQKELEILLEASTKKHNALQQQLQETRFHVKNLKQSLDTYLQNYQTLEQQLTTLFEISPLGILHINHQGYIQKANPGAIHMLGYPLAFLITHHLKNLMTQEYHERVLQKIQSMDTYGESFSLDVECIHHSEDLIPVKLSITKLALQSSTFYCQIEDKRLLKRALEAEKSKQEAEMASRAKSSFLSNMGHELRTPLNGILGYAQILARDPTLNAEQQEGIQVIEQSGEFLLSLINDILDISRMEMGKVELYPVDFHFGKFLQDTVTFFQIRAKQKGISFSFEPLNSLPVGLYADEKRLRQILMHLLGNAIKFTSKGGVIFNVSFKDGKVCFRVADTGIGIKEKELPEIFKPFYQVGTEYYHPEGMGLGLAIVQTLVQKMGGEVFVESEFGKGSVFRTELALQESKTIQNVYEEKSTITGFEGAQRTILIIDDKPENRIMLIRLLQPLGFKIYEASNGLEGLEKADELRPDLIFIDLVMPIMDGFESVRQMRIIPELKRIPVIATSASVFDDHEELSKEAGCNAFMTKPIDVDTLLSLIQQHLSLTWIYQEILEVNAVDTVTDIEQETANLIGPSPEQAKALFALVMSDELQAVVSEVETLAQKNSTLLPFQEKVRHFASEVQEEKLCLLIEKYM